MPSGRIHDRITLWTLPWLATIAFWKTYSGNVTLLIVGGFLFGGLMFGPDLDIYSRHYKRWGWFRWVWLPYQKSLRHRSFLSHGPIIGTTLRLIYLFCVFGCAFCVFLCYGMNHLGKCLYNSLDKYCKDRCVETFLQISGT